MGMLNEFAFLITKEAKVFNFLLIFFLIQSVFSPSLKLWDKIKLKEKGKKNSFPPLFINQ